MSEKAMQIVIPSVQNEKMSSVMRMIASVIC